MCDIIAWPVFFLEKKLSSVWVVCTKWARRQLITPGSLLDEQWRSCVMTIIKKAN